MFAKEEERRPASQNVSRGVNLHVSATPIINASRIFKQTQSVAGSGLFSGVIICGNMRAGLPRTEELTVGRRIERVGPSARPRRPSVTGRILEQLSWSRLVLRRYSSLDISVINAHSVAVLPVCYLLSRRTGAKLIYDTHELETETSTAFGLQGWIFKIIERSLISRCDAVFVVNRSIADWYKRRYPGIQPIAVRNISAVKTDWQPTDIRTQLEVPAGKRLFIFTGNLGEDRNIRAILHAFASPEVDDHIVFLSSGGELDRLVSESCTNYPNIHRLPPVSQSEVLCYTAACDAGFCLTRPNCLSHKLSLPNKAFEYAQAGLPFFFTDLPEIDRLLGPEFADWHVDDPVRDLTKAITGLTAAAITEARANLAEVRIPTWDEEAAAMIGVYRRLVDSVSGDRAKDQACQGAVSCH